MSRRARSPSSLRTNQLATRRRALGLNRTELGRLLGNNQPASEVADYETGRALPSPVIVLGLSRVLGCEPVELFDSDDDPLLVSAVCLRRRIEREDAAAPQIPDAVIDRLRQLLPAHADPGKAGGEAA